MSIYDLTPNPYDLPEFATDDLIDGLSGQNNVVEPTVNDKQYGWHPFRKRPERNVMNWLHRKTYENTDWLKNTFFPEVQAALKNNFTNINPYPIIGMNVDITSESRSDRPNQVVCKPGQCVLQQFNSVDPNDFIVVNLTADIFCQTDVEFGTSINGVNGLAAITPGTKQTLHCFLIERGSAPPFEPRLIFSTNPNGHALAGNPVITTLGYTHFRRLFSFQCSPNSSFSNYPRLPYARVLRNTLTWAQHDPNFIDLPKPFAVSGGAGNFASIDNTVASYSFDIPGAAPVLLKSYFAMVDGFTDKKMQIRGYWNPSAGWSGDTDVFNRNANQVRISNVTGDELTSIDTDIFTEDASSKMTEFRDNSAVPGGSFVQVYYKGYEQLRDHDFPYPTPA